MSRSRRLARGQVLGAIALLLPSVALGQEPSHTIASEPARVVSSADGSVSIELPDDASADLRPTFDIVAEDDLPPELTDFLLVGPVYDLGPDGTTFATPARVTLRLPPVSSGGPVPQAALATQDGTGAWVFLADATVTSTPDAVVIAGSTTHLSLFALFDTGVSLELSPTDAVIAVGEEVTAVVRASKRPAQVDAKPALISTGEYRHFGALPTKAPPGVAMSFPDTEPPPDEAWFSLRCDSVGTYELLLSTTMNFPDLDIHFRSADDPKDPDESVGLDSRSEFPFTLACIGPSRATEAMDVLERLLGLAADDLLKDYLSDAMREIVSPPVAPFKDEKPGIGLAVVEGLIAGVGICAMYEPSGCMYRLIMDDLYDACDDGSPIEDVVSIECGALRPDPESGPQQVGIIYFRVDQPFAALPEGVQTAIAVTRDDGKKGNNNPPRQGLRYDMLTCMDHLLAPGLDGTIEETDYTRLPWKTRASDAIFLRGEDWFAAIDPDPEGRYGATVLSGRNGMQRAEDLGITSFGIQNDGTDKSCKMPFKPGPLEMLVGD